MTALLTVNDFHVSHGKVEAVTGVNLEMQAGQIVNKFTTIDYRFNYRLVKALDVHLNPEEIPLLSLPVRLGEPGFGGQRVAALELRRELGMRRAPRHHRITALHRRGRHRQVLPRPGRIGRPGPGRHKIAIGLTGDPVPVGSRLRAHCEVLEANEVDNDGVQFMTRATVEREGAEKPVCVAEMVSIYYR